MIISTKRTAVTDQWQRHTGDWQHRDRHSHVLENVREDERGNPHDEKQTQLIAGKKRDKETRQQEQGEPADAEVFRRQIPIARRWRRKCSRCAQQ